MKLQWRSGKQNCIFQGNGGVSTPNILARKAGKGPLPSCKTGAESEGNNRPVSLWVSNIVALSQPPTLSFYSRKFTRIHFSCCLQSVMRYAIEVEGPVTVKTYSESVLWCLLQTFHIVCDSRTFAFTFTVTFTCYSSVRHSVKGILGCFVLN
jgi:hypothetical protein